MSTIIARCCLFVSRLMMGIMPWSNFLSPEFLQADGCQSCCPLTASKYQISKSKITTVNSNLPYWLQSELEATRMYIFTNLWVTVPCKKCLCKCWTSILSPIKNKVKSFYNARHKNMNNQHRVDDNKCDITWAKNKMWYFLGAHWYHGYVLKYTFLISIWCMVNNCINNDVIDNEI